MELTNFYPWIDSKLHEEVEPSVFYLMAASAAFRSVGCLNPSLVNIVEDLWTLYSRKEKEPPGKLHGLAGGGESWAQYL